MIRLAIFDCDGTLVDSQANICTAMESAFALHRMATPPRSAIRRIVGLNLIDAMAVLIPGADAEQHRAMADAYRAEFLRLRGSGAMTDEPLYPGIADILMALADSGWALGVATGKSDRGLDRVLAHHGIAHHFVSLQTADRHPSKPHPSMIDAAMADAGAAPPATVMIGDTSFDMAMARAAGVRGIGVAWGYHPADELIAAGADIVVDDVGQLLRALVPA